MKTRLPLIIALLFALWAGAGLYVRSDRPGTMAVTEFGRLPVISNGRFQPMDSLARNSLLQLREKQSVNLEPWKGAFDKPRMLSASEWLLVMMSDPATADGWPVFRIDHPDLKGLLGLPLEANPEAQQDGKHYSWNQLKGRMEDLQREARRASGLEQSHRTPYDQAIVRLWGNMGLYMRLQNTLQPQNARDWPAELNTYLSGVSAGVAAARAKQAGKEHDKAALETLMDQIQTFDAMQSLEPPLVVPPHHPEDKNDNWSRMGAALIEVARGEPPHFAISSYARMMEASRKKDAAGFNAAVAEYRGLLAGRFHGELSKASSEQRFNSYAPFYKAMFLYLSAFLLALFFWARPVQWALLRRIAYGLVVVGLLVHSSGLLYRMLLEGRPPVTNLYSSAIFIGWGACAIGLVLEVFWKNAIGLVISSVVGFLTLIIAHHLSLSGDTMEMMRAVLDTNFWLATHVVVVTLGYASTYVAGFLAILYVVLGVFTRTLEDGALSGAGGMNMGKALVKMIYGILCFATLFSFVGTVLGGIWADQSWGRFWGWDPKENGALIIVLWNALILHARWGGLVRQRGLVNLAIVGNIITSWSWFGVNMLGIGLHSYGFMDAAFLWLMAFVALCLAFLGLGLLPENAWRSFRQDKDHSQA